MSKLLVVGADVQYRHFDAHGTPSWRKGVIHSVRKIDTDRSSKVLSYLVDTGKDYHVDEVSYDVRSAEITKRVNEELDKQDLTGDERLEAFFDVVKDVADQKDLPKRKIVNETIRQPELVEVIPDDIKPTE